jgi:hypothetical protein
MKDFGDKLKNFILLFRKSFGNWSEILILNHSERYLYTLKLVCETWICNVDKNEKNAWIK